MADEFCPECGAKITGSTGFCPECGAVTTSLENKIKETERINREEKQKLAERKKQEKENRIQFLKKNKFYIIGILILIVAVVAAMSMMSSLDTSNKVYDCKEYSLEYPHNYTIGSRDHTAGSTGVIFTDIENKENGGEITISLTDKNTVPEDTKSYSLDYYKTLGVPVKEKGTKTVDGVKGYVLEYPGYWTSYTFTKGDIIYSLSFNENSYDCMDDILNSLKFK